jgi:nitroreductase
VFITTAMTEKITNSQLSHSVLEHVRSSTYKTNPMILNRWSPRSMTGEQLSYEELMSLFEAARWAPSSANAQSWRFIYATRNTEERNNLFNLLVDFNKIWAKNAAVLIVVVSKKEFEYNGRVIASVTHQFDTGAAWENLTLEATSRGLVAHGMEGFYYTRARKDLDIPDSFDVIAMIAIGKRDRKDKLPSGLQERETPSPRKPLEQMIMKVLFDD